MALMLSSATGTVCAQDRLYADEFPLGDVTLLEGPLKKARDLNINTLLSLSQGSRTNTKRKVIPQLGRT